MMLINVEMPTIAVILTFISMINITYDGLKARKVFIFQHFRFYEQVKFHAVKLSMKIPQGCFHNFNVSLSSFEC